MEFFVSKTMKKFYATLLTIVFVFSVSVPFCANAQPGTLGTESPNITATFTNSTGDVCDGNQLSAGEYNVQLVLSGMSYVSLFQITANTTADIVINSVTTVADNNAEFSVGGFQNEDNKLVVVLLSENEDTTAVSPSGETMITLNVTVNTPGDFADYFVVSDDFDLTYIEADFNDGYEPSYVVNTNTADDIHYPNISVDMSPVPTADTFDVTGQITIAEDINGASGTYGIVGITVSVDGTDISAVTDENGYYTLPGLAEGTYTLSISGSTTIDRTATLTVSADKATNGIINIVAVPIVICDYNKDGTVNSTDVGAFVDHYSEGTYVYADFNVDKTVNSTDIGPFLTFNGMVIQYNSVAL